MNRFAILPLLVLLAGCGHGPKTLILTIDEAPPSSEAARVPYAGPPIVVPAVHVPAALDRIEYVSQPSGGSVRVDDLAHWAAPLGLLARDALVRDLIVRLPPGKVAPVGIADPHLSRVLDVTITSLVIAPDRSTLQAAYRLLPNGPVRQVVVGAGGAPTPLVGSQVFSSLIGSLADRIAMDVN